MASKSVAAEANTMAAEAIAMAAETTAMAAKATAETTAMATKATAVSAAMSATRQSGITGQSDESRCCDRSQDYLSHFILLDEHKPLIATHTSS
jgi:hypothetical protein